MLEQHPLREHVVQLDAQNFQVTPELFDLQNHFQQFVEFQRFVVQYLVKPEACCD